MIRRAAVAILALPAVACGESRTIVHVAPLVDRGAFLEACHATDGAGEARVASDRRTELRELRLALRRALRPSLCLELRDVRPEEVAVAVGFETAGEVRGAVTVDIGARYDGALWGKTYSAKVGSTVVDLLFGSGHGNLSAEEKALTPSGGWPFWADDPPTVCGRRTGKRPGSRVELARLGPALGSDALIVKLRVELEYGRWERACTVDDTVEVPLPAGHSLAVSLAAFFAHGRVDLTRHDGALPR